MENQKILEALFKEATLGIIVINREGDIIEANPYSYELFGYTGDELLGKKVEILMPQSFRKQHVQHRKNYYKKPMRRSMGTDIELYGLRKDGTSFPINISLSYIELEGVHCAIAYISDDTVRQEMLQEIQQSKVRLDESQQLAHIGSFEVDIQTGETSWSDQMYHILGLPQKELISYEQLLSFVHPEDAQKVQIHEALLQKEKKDVSFAYRITTRDKGIRYVECRRAVKLHEDGTISKSYGLLQDVTELREARSINEDISKVLEDSLNEIYIFTADNLKFIQVNKGARRNIGYTLEEMQELTPVDITPEFDKALFLETIVPLINGTKEELVFETMHKRKDASVYPVEVHLQYSKIGKEPVFVAFINDLTERKNYEKSILEYSEGLENKIAERTQELQTSETKLRDALEKEKELGELKSRFVSMASHEFRTPLSSILSSASLISRYEKEDQQDRRLKHVNRIQSSVRNLTLILNDFLSLEKLESGKVRYSLTEIDFSTYMQQIIEELRFTAKQGQQILHRHEGDDIIRADQHMLKNVIINLVSNAIKYSPEGKTIHIVSQKDQQNFQLNVIDEGIGIPEANQKHMFTRFFRADNVTNIQGTGLGLTIVKRYLDLMNGTIRFTSKEGEGSTFTISIPQK